MRRSTLIALSLLLPLTVIMAQGGPPPGRIDQRQSPEEMAKTRANMFQEEFGLSEEQREKTEKALLESAKNTRKEVMELRQSGANRNEMMELMVQKRSEVEKTLKKIFTEEQWMAYEKWLKENPPQGRRRLGGDK